MLQSDHLTAVGLSQDLLKQDPILNHDFLKGKTNFDGKSLPKGVDLCRCKIQPGLLSDALSASGKNTIALAQYIDGEMDEGQEPDYDLERYRKNQSKYDNLFNSMKDQNGLAPSYRPPILLNLPSGKFARLDGKHRLGFLIYLGISEAELLIVDARNCTSYTSDLIKSIESHLSNKGV